MRGGTEGGDIYARELLHTTSTSAKNLAIREKASPVDATNHADSRLWASVLINKYFIYSFNLARSFLWQ